MNRLKHILVVVALLATVMPCVHAVAHHHYHDESAERCAVTSQPCACHSCEEHPCADNIEIQLDRTPDTTMVMPSTTPVLLYILPETEPSPAKASPPVSGVIAVLQTVQLLI